MTVTAAQARGRTPAGEEDSFVYEALPMRVVFGAGSSARLGAELEALGLERVLVLCTPEQRATADGVAAWLGSRCVGVYPGARMHVPVASVDDAVALARTLRADGCVAVGGGSATGLGKGVALRHGLTVVAVPTTYAGSEMTPIWGLTEGGVKRTGRDRAVLPRAVVYDPDLTASLPVPLSVSSGLNAMAHAVEGLWAPDRAPGLALRAGEGIRLLAGALPVSAASPRDPGARGAALRGAWLCGAVLGGTTMSLHHKICHVLGGTYDLPHAETHAVVLPHVLAFNATAAPYAVDSVAAALGVAAPTAATDLWELAGSLGAPTTLASLGLPPDAIADVVRRVLAVPYANPRPVEAPALTRMLQDALAGRPPATVSADQ